MKRFLVTTTALASLVAGTVFAEAPTVTVGGMVDFQSGTVKQSSNYKTYFADSPNQKSTKFISRSQIYVGATSKAENGVIYGANAVLNPTSQSDNMYTNGKVDRTYLFIESSAGRVEMGSNYSVSKLMSVGAESVARATGGASIGDWASYVNFYNTVYSTSNTLADSNAFITTGDTLASRISSTQKEEARKITWMSPRYSGLQLGLSFSPDGNNNGTGTAGTDTNTTTGNLQVTNLWSIALNYAHTHENMNVALSAAYDNAKAASAISATKNNLKSYKLGAAVGSGDVTAAVSYGNDGKSLTEKTASGSSQKYYTAGVAYETGPFAASLTYFNSKMGDSANGFDKLKAYAVGVDYTVAPGVKPFAEVTLFNAKPSSSVSTLGSNKGTVFLVGTSLSF